MFLFWPFILITGVLFQNGSAPAFPDGIFTAKEKEKIEKNADDLEERMEAYRDASVRINKSIQKAFSGREYGQAALLLETWTTLLSESLKDIEANLDRDERKPKDLIKYEIQIRKAVKDIRDYKIRAPGDQQDDFDRCISLAESVRMRMVEILFNPGGDTGK
jgi:hypothetical protein